MSTNSAHSSLHPEDPSPAAGLLVPRLGSRPSTREERALRRATRAEQGAVPGAARRTRRKNPRASTGAPAETADVSHQESTNPVHSGPSEMPAGHGPPVSARIRAVPEEGGVHAVTVHTAHDSSAELSTVLGENQTMHPADPPFLQRGAADTPHAPSTTPGGQVLADLIPSPHSSPSPAEPVVSHPDVPDAVMDGGAATCNASGGDAREERSEIRVIATSGGDAAGMLSPTVSVDPSLHTASLVDPAVSSSSGSDTAQTDIHTNATGTTQSNLPSLGRGEHFRKPSGNLMLAHRRAIAQARQSPLPTALPQRTDSAHRSPLGAFEAPGTGRPCPSPIGAPGTMTPGGLASAQSAVPTVDPEVTEQRA
ncbi:hypothetical protein K466DRAFT_606840 [Polyporus arcularius HHB13444]|uniref:Uncharacterized protein n=1 Tax=Polyporus arcularius HHB13444 TaxID=1314778 RepID=A0A5C3NYS4_9APHY|nr:hypothetical protein K466DRAFT_606840 [Polyporus arcularius HHB13444]